MDCEIKIRRDYERYGLSIKAIKDKYNLSRNTVRRILREGVGKKYKTPDRERKVLGPYKNTLEKWLYSDLSKDKKQRKSAMRMFRDLEKEGYEGSYQTVQKYVQNWKKNISTGVSGVYIPLEFDAADAYQFDWSHERVIINGISYKLMIAHFKLCYSRKIYVIAYFNETQDMLFDAHDKAFNYFGGLTHRGIYDNMSTAVDLVFMDKRRTFNRRFLYLMNHYMIEPVACSVASGWEKGQVEKLVRDFRDYALKIDRDFTSIDEINEYLLSKCIEHANTMYHPDFKDKTIEEVYQEEKGLLGQLKTPFNSYGEKVVKSNHSSLISFDKNYYSVECTSANKKLVVRSYPSKVLIYDNDICVGEHDRCFGKDNTLYEPMHYVEALVRKPGALRNGKPFKDFDLPESIKFVKDVLMKELKGDRQFVDILIAVKNYGLDAVEVACSLAIENGAINSNYILSSISSLSETESSTKTIENAPKVNNVPKADIGKYDQLIRNSK